MRYFLVSIGILITVFFSTATPSYAGYVNGYFRSNGTYVNSYYRNSPSASSIKMPSTSVRMPSLSTRNYSNGGSLRLQSGYLRSNGTYVQPYLKTSPDNTIYNNRKYILGY